MDGLFVAKLISRSECTTANIVASKDVGDQTYNKTNLLNTDFGFRDWHTLIVDLSKQCWNSSDMA